MPTTFMGRDNNGKPCYHVRKADGVTVSDMKSGVADDTLFHSSLPYLQVVVEATATKTKSLSKQTFSTTTLGFTNYYDIFTIPSTITAQLAAKKGVLVICTWSDGSTSLVEISPVIAGWKSKRAAYSGVPTMYSAGASAIGNFAQLGMTGWYALPYIPSTGDFSATGVKTADQVATLANNNSGGSLTINNSTTCHLTTNSKCIVFHRANGSDLGSPPDLVRACYAESPTPISLRFLVLNVTINDTMSYSTLNYSGDIKLQKSGLYIGGVNILSGKSFIQVNSSSKVPGNAATGEFTGSMKVSNATLPNNQPPFGTTTKYNKPYSDTSHNEIGGVTPYIFGLLNGSIVNKYYLSVHNLAPATAGSAGYTSLVSYMKSALSYYSVDTFSVKDVPSNVSSCVMNDTSLYVNGTQIFSSASPFIYPALSVTSQIDIPAFTYSGSSVGVFDTTLATFTVAKPSNRLTILYHTNKLANATVSMSDTMTNGTLTYNLTSKSLNDNLNLRIASLSDNQRIHLATFAATRYYDPVSSSLQPFGASVTYMMSRVGSTISIIRRVLVTANSGTSTFTIPGFLINYIQLASAF